MKSVNGICTIEPGDLVAYCREIDAMEQAIGIAIADAEHPMTAVTAMLSVLERMLPEAPKGVRTKAYGWCQTMAEKLIKIREEELWWPDGSVRYRGQIMSPTDAAQMRSDD